MLPKMDCLTQETMSGDNNGDNKMCLLVDYSASSFATVFFNSPEEIIPGRINYISIKFSFF
jgi:hypothetical protein